MCNKVFRHVDDNFELLKLHKYFDWVDKKLHSHNFMDNRDQITDDLLLDFKDPSSVAVRPGILSQKAATVPSTTQNKPQGLVMEDKSFLQDMNLLIRGGTRKADPVDINSKNDFPEIGQDFGAPAKEKK